MKVILIGPPGAGKGTQARFIAEVYKIALISTGDMLRAASEQHTVLGKKIKDIIESGQLVQDDDMAQLIKERILQPDARNGFVFDGFPRTLAQAELLEKINLKIDYVFAIPAPDELIIERLAGRWIHQESGRVYHVKYHPPRQAGIDDITGEELIQRDDDKLETIKKRLKIYHERTEPLIKFYENSQKTQFYSVDGSQSVFTVRQEILKILKKR